MLILAGGGMAGVIPTGVVVSAQSLDHYACLGIELILAVIVVLNALSSAISR